MHKRIIDNLCTRDAKPAPGDEEDDEVSRNPEMADRGRCGCRKRRPSP
jgi:hypothetical protein